MVACCGTCQDGSLRVLRNGIGIFEQATIDMPGVQGMWLTLLHPSHVTRNSDSLTLFFSFKHTNLIQGIWALTANTDSTETVAICVTFVGATAFLALNGEGVGAQKWPL